VGVSQPDDPRADDAEISVNRRTAVHLLDTSR
jgi:hypothetical protein